MPDSKLSGLTALTAAGVAAIDLMLVSDMSVPESKKMTMDTVLDGLLRVAAAADCVLTVDATNGKLVVRQRGGTPGTDELQISHDGTVGIVECKEGFLSIRSPGTDNTNCVNIQTAAGNAVGAVVVGLGNSGGVALSAFGAAPANGIDLGADAVVAWGPGSPLSGTQDTAMIRKAANVAGMDTGDWFQQTGRSRVNTASPVTNATDTMAAITGLSATLIAGRKYAGTLTLFVSTDQAAEGVKFDFDGGAGTMTAFNAAVTSNVQGATAGVTVSAALATDITFTALNGTGVNCFVISFDLVCNAAGTFIPRFSQVAHASGTATIVAANLSLDDYP
jgi:hypothetical protein